MSSRVALVTGGTGGIGTAICERLARSGHTVVTNYRNEERARARALLEGAPADSEEQRP